MPYMNSAKGTAARRQTAKELAKPLAGRLTPRPFWEVSGIASLSSA